MTRIIQQETRSPKFSLRNDVKNTHTLSTSALINRETQSVFVFTHVIVCVRVRGRNGEADKQGKQWRPCQHADKMHHVCWRNCVCVSWAARSTDRLVTMATVPHSAAVCQVLNVEVT